MEVSKEILKEIAGYLDTGFRVFLNTKTLEIVYLPDENKVLDFDSKIWKSEFAKVKKKSNSFIEIENISSHENFRIMENFINSISDKTLAAKLTQAIEGYKPFANFKFQIDQSGPFRLDWFKFKENEIINFVKSQLET